MYKRILSVIAAFSLVLTPTFGVLAQEESQAYLNALKTTPEEFQGLRQVAPTVSVANPSAQTANGILRGTFDILNGTDQIVSGVTYELQLMQELPDITETPDALIREDSITYAQFPADDVVSLPANGSTSLAFEEALPPLPQGDYQLRIQLHTDNNRPLGWADVSLGTIGSATSFAIIESPTVEVTATDPATGETADSWGPQVGPNVTASEQLFLTATVRGTIGTPFTATPLLHVQRDLVADDVTQRVTDTPITVTNEPQTIRIPLTAGVTPGVYAVDLQLQNEAGVAASNLIEYRYVVKGASASVVAHTIESLPSKAGETAVIHFTVNGAADRETVLQGDVEIALLDPNGGVLGQTESSLNLTGLGGLSGTARITLEKDICAVPDLRITIRDASGATLDEYQTTITGATLAPCGVTSVASLPRTTIAWIVAGVVLLVLLAALTAWLQRRRKQTGSTPDQTNSTFTAALLILLGLTLASFYVIHEAPFAKASGIQWTDSADNNVRFYLYVNAPLFNQDLPPDKPFKYSVLVNWINCGNVPTAVELELYSSRLPIHAPYPFSNLWSRRAHTSQNKATVNPNGSSSASGSLRLRGYITPPKGWDKMTLWTIASSNFKNRYFSRHDLTWVNFPTPTPTPASTPTTPTSTPTPQTSACSDTLDNDGDGVSDASDPGCHIDDDPAKPYDPNDTDENQAPIAVITTQQVFQGERVHMDGAQSSDPDGSISTWTWLVTAPDGTNVNAPAGSASSFIGDQLGNYVLRLTVTDNKGATSSTSTSVAVLPEQVLAVIKANGDTVNEPVELDGSASLPSGKITTYQWSVTGPTGAAVSVTNATSAQATFTPDRDGVFKVSLTVTDNKGQQNTGVINLPIGAGGFSPGPVQETD